MIDKRFIFALRMTFLDEEVDVGGVKGVGKDAAEASGVEILKELDVVGGVFTISEEVEVGVASDEDVIDAALGFDSCFSGHRTIASLMLDTGGGRALWWMNRKCEKWGQLPTSFGAK